jgi:squalene synthase HpnC
MTSASDLRSGKGHRDENFPVASWLIAPRHRAPVLAFYNFVRTADDITDHASLGESDKLAHLDRLEAALTGRDDGERVGVALRAELKQRELPPRHALDLLTAFKLDVTKRRYADWDDLIGYCRYSAMPVGRFVLDVHGESETTWPANDALCAALQIINHLQDCQKDFRNLDRVYLPQDALAAAGTDVEALNASRASPELRQCLVQLARGTSALLDESRVFSRLIKDFRLAMEVAVIQSLAERLVGMLQARDPLSERVHLGKSGMALTGLAGIARGLSGRLLPIRSKPATGAPLNSRKR